MLRMIALWFRIFGKRLIIGLLLASVVIAFAQTLPLDAAFWLGSETLMYVDVVLGVTLATTLVQLRPAIARLRLAVTRFVRRVRRRTRRIGGAEKARRPGDADDDRPWLPAMRSLAAC